MRARRAAAVSAVAVLAPVVLAVGGCGAGAEPGGRSSSPPAGSESPSADEVPTEPSGELPESTPLPDPATGPRLDVEGISVRVPESWKRGYDTAVVATAQGPQGIMDLATFPGEPRSLRYLFRRDVGKSPHVTSVERLDDVAIGGRSAYHYRARSRFYVIEGFGLSDAGSWVSISFDLLDRVPAEKRREIVESVLATYESDL
jgi:hypothetical protein